MQSVFQTNWQCSPFRTICQKPGCYPPIEFTIGSTETFISSSIGKCMRELRSIRGVPKGVFDASGWINRRFKERKRERENRIAAHAKGWCNSGFKRLDKRRNSKCEIRSFHGVSINRLKSYFYILYDFYFVVKCIPTGRAGEERYSSDWWIFLADEKEKFERCFFFLFVIGLVK